MSDTTTLTTTSTVEMAPGAVIAIVICSVLFMGLLIWLGMLCQLYFYMISPQNLRPQGLMDATQNDGCHMACNLCNAAIIHSCCPSADTNADIYNRGEVVVARGDQHTNSAISMFTEEMTGLMSHGGGGGVNKGRVTFRDDA